MNECMYVCMYGSMYVRVFLHVSLYPHEIVFVCAPMCMYANHLL